MRKCYVYILLCSNGQFYVGSTKYLELRMGQHFLGKGAKFTRKYPPVKCVYLEEFSRIDYAYYRERQIHGWSHRKKQALIDGDFNLLRELSKSKIPSASSASSASTGSADL